ncbi:MAG: hypothetical protein ABSD67_00745 [Terracidiphilus sp.]
MRRATDHSAQIPLLQEPRLEPEPPGSNQGMGATASRQAIQPPVLIDYAKLAPAEPNPVPAFLEASNLKVTRITSVAGIVHVESALTLLERDRNAKIFYAALLGLAPNGVKVTDHIWRVQVGYTQLKELTHLSSRAILRLRPRLAAINYVVEYPAPRGRSPYTYWVRTEDGVIAMLKAAGCNYVRFFADSMQIELLARAPGSAGSVTE